MKLSKLKIIIIEDDLLFSCKLENWLANNVSTVQVFTSAEDGIDPITIQNPDIIILDNLLPKLKGREVLELYKVCSPESTIIMMSAVYSVDEIAKSIQNKADFLFDKNKIDQDSLLDILKTAIDKKDQKGGIWNSISSFASKLITSNSKQIAIVEDDEIFAKRIEKIVKDSSSSHEVNFFTDATDFFNYCEHSNPGIIFLDYNFPDINGMDILLFIRNVLPKAKVVIISSQEKPEIALKLMENGIVNYIVKDENWKVNLSNIIEQLQIK